MKTFLIALGILLSINSFSKGAHGVYYIEGTAHSAAQTVLSNALITVNHNGEQTEYMTDSKGRFKIKINWTIPCKSGLPADKWDSAESDYNEKWIHIYFKCQGTKVENQWKLYSGIYEDSRKGNIRYLDIYFQN